MKYTKCPKCGYERSGSETTPDYECPSCGVVYEKYLSSRARLEGQRAVSDQVPRSAMGRTTPVRPAAAGSDTVPMELEPAAERAQRAGRLTRVWLRSLVEAGVAHRVLLGVAVGGFVLGYFSGREHLKYEIRATFENAATSLGSALAGRGNQPPPAKLPKIKRNAELVVPTLVRKGFYEGKYGQAEITFTLNIENRTGRDIRAFDGLLTFTDLLGNEIISSQMAINDPVAKAQTMEWSGSLNYNQFRDSHQRLRAAERENMKLVFAVSKILFVDGETKQYD